MLWITVILLATLLVAFANGANDNFKGVATLFGSRTAGYRSALNWATATTFAGSLTSFFFASSLAKTFSGKGLVPDGLVGNPIFLTSSALGAGLTVLLAARMGIPISTTHSLTGALAGSGLVALSGGIAWDQLFAKFFVPLLVSPVVAAVLTAALYPAFRRLHRRMRARKETCLCINSEPLAAEPPVQPGGTVAASVSLDIMVDDTESCARTEEVFKGRILGLEAQATLDRLHFLSAGAVGFSRGLNDTPKIVALSLAGGAAGLELNIGLVAVAMALGGWLMARRVAETVSWRITEMNHGQGFTANLVTSLLVVFASRLGVPVSTTHVSCGSLFGLGLVSGRAHWKVIGGILGAWVLTLPFSALLSAGAFWALSRIS